MMILISGLILFGAYSLLMLDFYRRWKNVPLYEPREQSLKKLSVIIAARNEEQYIGQLLDALQKQDYPTAFYEIIVVDDHSTDRTKEIVQSFPDVQLVCLTEKKGNSFKKMALEKGIQTARHDWIVCTDADCIPGPGWLTTMAAFAQEKKASFVAAPVVFSNTPGLLGIFQSLDFLALQGISAVAVHHRLFPMSNGANLMYRRDMYQEVHGFEGIDQKASGDDMLLLNKIWKKDAEKVHYLLSSKAVVETAPMHTWKTFFYQRIRWASKNNQYRNGQINFVMGLVYLFNLFFLLLAIYSCWQPSALIWLIILLLAKTIIEWPFINSVAQFYQRQHLLKYFFFFQPLHIAYTITVGFLGLFSTYEWKGRKVK